MTAAPAPTRPPRDVALIDDLRALPAETVWVEFKHENTDPDGMGKRIAALSNAARIEGQDTAYMVWGVEDGTHRMLGTSFEPDATKVRGQPLALWLAQNLQPSPAFGFRVVAHTLGRLVLLEIPAAPGAPVCFQNIPYVRIGSATPKLTDYPERFQRLIDPVPQPGGLGVHLTLDLQGQARFGPDVQWVDGIDYTVDPKRADAFYAEVRRYWPALPDGALQPGYAGIRPKLAGPEAPNLDFRIDGPAQHGVPGLINLLGIESPGLTASLAIGDLVAEVLAS
jgi:hypothetical protein